MPKILNVAGYKFITLTQLPDLRATLLNRARALALKGTILLSPEGINVSLAGVPDQVSVFIDELSQDSRFSDIVYKESVSDFQPFRRIKVKIKQEIITLRLPEISPEQAVAPEITPQEFKQWLDENRDITILDTRNDYEVQFGTFQNAVNLKIKDFGEFPKAAKSISQDKPIVMFCTGGIRCEKAAWVMLNDGYSQVFQLKGGILNYFAEVGGSHYDGECYVFDQRVGLDPNLQPSGSAQCMSCYGPIKNNSHSCSL